MATTSTVGAAPIAAMSARFDATDLKPKSKAEDQSSLKSWLSTKVSVETRNESVAATTAASSPEPTIVCSPDLSLATVRFRLSISPNSARLRSFTNQR